MSKHLDEILTLKGKNLFDKEHRTRIYGYFQASGTTWSYASAAYSNKIPCKPNTTYTIRYNGNSSQTVLGVGSCSTDNEPSSTTQSVTVTQAVRQNSPTLNTPVTITTGSNDKWLIIAYNVAEPEHTDMADNLQIEEGSSATPFEPYVGEFKTIGGVPGKNLFDKSITDNLLAGYVNNVIVGESTVFVSYAGGDKSILIPVKPSTTYTIKRKTGISTVYDRIRVAGSSSGNKNNLTMIINIVNNATQESATFTTLADTTAIVFNCRNSGTVGDDWQTYVDNLMLVEGTTVPTEYEPYKLSDVWQRGVPTTSVKGATTTINNSRKCVNLFDKATKAGSVSGGYSGKIPTKPGTTYIIKNFNRNDRIDSSPVKGYTQSGTESAISVTYYPAGSSYSNCEYIKFTIPDGCVSFVFGIRPLTMGAQVHWEDVMLVEGTTAPTAYYPYFSPTAVMSHLAAYGGQVQRHKQNKLWSRYVPCTHIESSGTEWIDTDYTMTSDVIECGISLIGKNTGSNKSLFGSESSGVSSRYSCIIYGSDLYIGGSTQVVRFTYADDKNDIVVKTTSGTAGTLTLNGVDTSFTYNDGVQKTISLALFGNKKSDGVAQLSSVKVKHFYIKDNGVLVRDMIPVKDIVDNVYGMYDRVNDKFYGNTGTGAFTGGDLIQPIAYAESDGTAYADTGIIPTTFDYTITYEGAIKDVSNGPNCAWGYMGNSGNLPRWVCAGYSNNYLLNANTTNSIQGADTNNHVFVGKVYEISGAAKWLSQIDGVIKQDNLTLQNPETWVTNTLSIYLFARNNEGTAGNFAPATMKRWICEKAGVVIKHYIPVRIGTTVELLDLVNWQFATRTGSFIAGPDIPYDLIVPQVLKCNKGDIAYGQYGKNRMKFSTGSADSANIHMVADGECLKFSGSGDMAGNYIYAKVSGDTFAYKTSINDIKSYTTEPVIIKAGETVKFIRANTDYIRYCYLTTSDGDATSFSWGADNLVKSYTASKDITAVWCQYSRADGNPDLPSTIYLGVFDTDATAYEPYHFGLHADGSHKIFINGKNLFNSYLDRCTWSQNVGIESTKSASTTRVGCNDFIAIKPNTTYTIKMMGTQTFDASSWRVMLCDENNIVKHKYTTSTTGISLTFVTSADEVKLSFFIAEDKTSLDGWNFMLVEGHTAPTEYEPYIGIEREVNDLLYSADDYACFQTGKRHNEWAIHIYDGVNLKASSKQNNVWLLNGVDKVGAKTEIICTHFPYSTGSSSTAEDHTCMSFNSYQYGFRADEFSTAEEVNAWLASEYAKGTPVMFAIPLATPTDTDIVTEKVALTTKGQKTIASQAEISVTVQATDLEK